ncbi:hypothetical protein N7539_004523 [Penicillium diatomitis]|uniref:RNA polymerase-associated protein LEO1 n=1 Tax=Penicillium diatomitis TaxID=2819901 RepID=A0A9W9XEM7_9EURO|nr:uncharacterized protein N7539_004523 [Penicillium diatomitis]KAJ5489633.1 hypothetical protein N7539_004523 [Penicillium diatomitis]
MSSSDEEAVRRPGRNAVNQSPDMSDAGNDSGAENTGLGAVDALDDDADLFGSDGSDGGFGDTDQPHRNLDDEQLDSGDDEGRYDRHHKTDGAFDEEPRSLTIAEMTIARAPVPATSGPEVYTMRVPDFLSIESEEFNPETYIAPAYSTASTSLCWRRDPEDENKLQSNARIIQWEDGSITLQLASNPTEQYHVSSKPLAPLSKSGEYNTKLDSHVYLGAGLEQAELFRLTSHVTHGLTVLPTALESDEAVQRLQESLAAATRAGKTNTDGGLGLVAINLAEDPELAARKAEQMEKEATRAERRRQQLADREADRSRRVAAPRTMGNGLSVGGLEDDGSRPARPRAKPRRTNRRGEIMTDEEEDYGRGLGRTREDEYDEDDGFLVGSDEEIEEEGDDDDEEELEDEDMDAEGEDDDEVAPSKPAKKPEVARDGTPPARKKNRYVVDDDDEEDE